MTFGILSIIYILLIGMNVLFGWMSYSSGGMMWLASLGSAIFIIILWLIAYNRERQYR